MTRVVTVSALLLLLPGAALAQTTQGPLVLERIESPFVVAPDYKITDLDGSTGQLAGAYGGRLFDKTLFVGGGYYWLVDGSGGEEMRYGGLILGWSIPAGGAVRLSARGLVGFGTATLETGVLTAVPRPHDRFTTLPGQSARVLLRDDFFVFEPQLNAALRVVPHVGVELGGGYRIHGATDALEDRLNGVSGNVAVQLTW